MSTSPAAAKLVVTEKCPTNCSLNPANLPISDQVTEWFNQNKSFQWIAREAEKAGFHLAPTSIGRHRSRHVALQLGEQPEPAPEKVDHLAVLEKIIAQGAKGVDRWRIGPSETLKAMDMYYKLTQGSAFQALFDALAGAAAGEEGAELPVVDDATFSPAEREAQETDDSG